jgi:lipoprotein signal peptidase
VKENIMKSKRLFLPAIILAVAILAIAVYSVVSSIAFKPAVTEGEFRFSITYELDGERVIIEDVYKVHYVRNDGYADTKSRVYAGELVSSGEDNTLYTLKKDENTRVELWTHFYPDYLMGDPEYDYFDDEAFEPRIYYYDAEEQEYSDEETLAAQGVKLISFEYPTPIENSLVFSHISYFSGAVVLPTLLIALLALIATIIFVRKEKELKYKAIHIVSIVLNFVIGFTLIPFVSILAVLIDIGGGGPELYYQVLYFIPAFSLLCITASVTLRRKGYGVKSLIAELIGPAVFAVYLIVCGVLGLL